MSASVDASYLLVYSAGLLVTVGLLGGLSLEPFSLVEGVGQFAERVGELPSGREELKPAIAMSGRIFGVRNGGGIGNAYRYQGKKSKEGLVRAPHLSTVCFLERWGLERGETSVG